MSEEKGLQCQRTCIKGVLSFSKVLERQSHTVGVNFRHDTKHKENQTDPQPSIVVRALWESKRADKA